MTSTIELEQDAIIRSHHKPFASLDFEKGEILTIDKPEGWTSFDVVKKVRSLLRVKKVGHAGTLDPFATGVLVVCTGRATKRVSALMGLDKEYVACLELGKETDTFDVTGKIVRRGDPGDVTAEKLQRVCADFRGEIEQIPPMFSAVKVGGKRLYKLARKGQVVERRPRRVVVHELELLHFENPFATIRVVCSKGTYIRTLAHDIGRRLGCGAYLKSLTRTRVGSFRLENALTVEELAEQAKNRSVLK
ncbi:MAG: tRNA pseudouridine(55) synthase TruB [Calditrichaeota bacterium]|nr:MAG: tRNA pseudouridine(55) synthase TruB [Calditrichota bacterium]